MSLAAALFLAASFAGNVVLLLAAWTTRAAFRDDPPGMLYRL